MTADYTWNDFTADVSDAAKTIGDAASEAFDQGKKQIKKYSLKRNLNELFRKLGETVYNEHESGNDCTGEKEALFREIASVKEEIKKYETTESAADIDGIICPKCGSVMPKTAQYCIKCGEKLA